MTPAQLESVVAATGHDRYRWLTSEANPDTDRREGYRRIVAAKAEAMASGEPPAYPSLARQAVNLAGSLASHAVNGLATVSEEEKARRLAICRRCPSYDPCQARCRECGCYMDAKAAWESEACPLGKW